ncbi:DHH family phosphoesterase [Gorillibacterium massiliense]|uniref:DHH family phosphoesterase n=1 Tax=Gorillibacterium massiliense TaxID=1280390 RepID=UPI0004BCF361|nr:DHH family phosphoesterase [Gorillibacterium massiliense]
MPDFLLKRWHGRHMMGAFVLALALSGLLFVFDWALGVAGLVLCGVLVYFLFRAEKAFQLDLNRYLETLSLRIRKAGNDVLHELPIGILLYDEEKRIEWHNPFITAMLGKKEPIIGESFTEIFPTLRKKDKEKDGRVELRIENRMYQALLREEERLIYFQDITEKNELSKKYQEERIAIGLVFLDNLDEASQGMDDQTRSVLLGKVVGELNEWTAKFNLYSRRLSSERYLLMMNNRSLQLLEQDRFDILDRVRDMTADLKVPLTLSIGVAGGGDSLVELGQLAQTSLDMALGRGGDQVTVKVGQRTSFYGGRSNAVEKRTRVRARVIAHALRDLIKESENVVIMGHKVPDLDSIGAAIGVLKAVQLLGKEGFIVVESASPSIVKLLDVIKESEKLARWIVTPEQALQLTTPRSLAVVVDTHKASMVAESRLLSQTHRVVVVDHHRRSEDYLQDALLIYMEPYASSTCELVTELLQYIHDRLTLDSIESTALLAGMMMDTKNFSVRTGSRTFDAASFLRRYGADMALIQQMQKEDFRTYVSKAEMIKHTEILYDQIALAVAEPGNPHTQVLIAQAADTLLTMANISASFVISERPDGLIGISARSTGELNVQVVMERMKGGGHLNNAATQWEGTVEGAEQELKRILADIIKEEGFLE